MQRKFVLWLLVFFVLLAAIPFLAFQENYTAAKVVGIATVVLVTIALRLWTNASKRKSLQSNRVILNRNDEFWLQQHCAFYNGLSGADVQTFKDRMGLFLANVPIDHANGESTDRTDCFPVAADYVLTSFDKPWALPASYQRVELQLNSTDVIEQNVRKVSNEMLLEKMKKS